MCWMSSSLLFILTRHIQGVPHFETDALGRLSQGASIPASSLVRVSLCLQEMTHFFLSSGQLKCHALVPETLLCVLHRSLVERKHLC